MRLRGFQGARTATLLLAIMVFFIPASALPQIGDTGQIQGTVTDTSGAVVPGATVTATAVATNHISTAVTNNDGFYAFPSLRVGQYTIQVGKQGFKTAFHAGITLSIQQVVVVNVALEVGAVSQSIQVTAAAPLMETQTASQGQVIESKRIEDLPLNGRDYVQLALLSQGVVQPLANSRFGGFSAGGQRVSQNNYLLNGMDNNEMEIAAQGLQAEVVKPIVDAVQEFKVQTSGYSAEFGRASGAVLNLTIKSGTNEYHGSAWEFFRNDVLDARDFFNKAPQAKAPFRRNQFGGTFGGPVLTNKLFFFQALEGQRRRESAIHVDTLPTLKERQGDFSEFSKPVFDPNTFDPATGQRQPFPNNIIPRARFDPVASMLLPLIPLPQQNTLSRNFTFVGPLGFNEFKDDSRVDYDLGTKDTFAWTFDWQGVSDLENDDFPGPLGIRLNRTATLFHGTATSLQWTHVLRPTFLMSTKIAWNRRYTVQPSGHPQNLNSQIGLKGITQTIPSIAQFDITGITTLGGPTFTPNLTQSQNRQFVSDLSYIKGKHQIKFGVNIQRLQSLLDNPQQGIGQFGFNGNFTRNPKGNVGGNAFADFLLGIPNTTTVTTNVFINMRAYLDAGYIQDRWKVGRNLTVDYGVRYEVFLPWEDKRNALANFVPNPALGPEVRLVLARNGSGRVSRSLIAPDTNNFAPRFGFAYNLGHQTVLRGAYGIFYGSFEPSGGGQFLETNPPFKLSAQISTDSIHPALTLGSGVPDVLTPENLRAPFLSSFPVHFAFPYSQQFNFNVQHTFARDWLVQVGYFGTTAHHLLERMDLNQPLPGPGNINPRRPFKSLIFPGTDLVVTPLAGFNSHLFIGNSNYNSFQAKLEKRLSQGFTVLSSYVFSRALSDTCGVDTAGGQAPGCAVQNVRDLRAEYGLDNQQVKHRFVASYIYELPFGRGRSFGKNWSGVLNAFLGNWATDGIVTLTSGVPISITVPGDPANVGGFNSVQRPNIVGDPARPSGADVVNEFFSTAAFKPAAPFTFGNAARNILIGPSFKNWDFGMFKDTPITEKADLQFRFEAFNFTNTPHFSTPGNTLGTANFGQISGTSSPNRKLQFALKLIF